MSNAGQLVLDIVPPPSFAAEDFIVGIANENARGLIDTLAWPTPVVLTGETGSGKTHLAHLFADRFADPHWFDGASPLGLTAESAVLIDGLETWTSKPASEWNEDALFHTLEAARCSGPGAHHHPGRARTAYVETPRHPVAFARRHPCHRRPARRCAVSGHSHQALHRPPVDGRSGDC